MVPMSTNPLAGLLRKSPFVSIQEHMRTVYSCVELLPVLFESLSAQDFEGVQGCVRQIEALETEADQIKYDYRHSMPKTLFLPVDRKDLLSLIHEQDALCDGVERVGQLVSMRDMRVIPALQDGLKLLVSGTVIICRQALDMIEELDELLHVGFGGKEHDKVITMISGVRKREHKLDTILYRINRSLFEREHELDPVSVMFWYKILEEVGNVSDHAENIADHLLLFLSR